MSVVSVRGAKKVQDELEGFALSLPEAWFDTPWDESRVSKVRKQIFAYYGDQDTPSIGVRLTESLDHARSMEGATAMAYDLGTHGWLRIPITGLHESKVEVLHHFVEESYRLVAPRSLIKQLDAELADE